MTPFLDQQLEFVVDSEAEPVDLDQALARFLLSLVRSQPQETPPAEVTT